MAKYTKPDLSIQWAQTGTISTPSDGKKQLGWTAEKPAFEYMNWLQNRQDTGIAYAFQMGFPEWDGTTEYQYAAGYASHVQYNGLVYKAIQTGTNKNPVSETAYWERAFDAYGSASTVNSALTAHITNYGTLASLSNVTTARSNLSVYSIAESVAAFAPIAGNSAQTFLVGSASSANHAVRKSQFDAKTGQATETTAGIAEVATNAETLAGASDTVVITPLKLQYMIDNRGATTSAKGTVELATNAETITGSDTERAVTPSNIVGLFGDSGRKTHSTNGYQKLPGGMVMQWGSWSGATTANNTNNVTFPISFPNACLNVQGTITGITGTGAGYGPYINTSTLDVASFDFGVVASGGGFVAVATSIYWFAIGY
jgi:hypothetical protein